MVLFRLLAILFALFISALHSLPWSIDISESQGPGTTLQSFSFNCSSYMPTLELLSVRPPTGFFNNPSLHRHKGVYVGKVTLSSSARLDALAVNRYELQLQYKCGNFVVEGPLFVHVQRDPGRFRCAGPFASPAGEFIYVPETVTPGALLYTLLLPGLGVQRAQMNITSAQDPPLFPGPFSIDEQGLLRAPSQGLRGQALKTFQLHILVSLGKGQSCKGMLTVKVLPAPSSQVSFPQKAQSITIPEDLVPGSKVIQVQARGSNLLYEIISPLPSPLYSIGQADGVVRTTAPLDLAHAQGAAVTKLQVRAFEKLRPWASAEFDLTVNVRAVNQWPPRCHPALLVTQVPETTPVGTVLSKLTCVDPDSAGAPLDFQLQFHNPPDSASLHLRDRVLEVNTTLDCDIPGACFQHAASILVLDDGQPQMTTEVPVLVMVTPVNEFSPACVPRTFRVREDAGPHTPLGSVVGTDMDYPHNSLEYYISGGPSTFAVDRLSGEIHLLGPLDYEQQRWYKIIILLIDHSQDWDLNRHRSGSCTVTIEVEDVNDHAPECEPPFQELTIYTPLGRSMEVTKVSCWIPQEPQRSALSYSIVGGNSQSRFRLQGTVLMHNDTVLGPPWPEQPCTYELLIHVADVGPSIPHLSTTTTIIVHLVPWRAGTVATSTHSSTVSSTMTPLIVTEVEAFWKPEPWFVVVLTATGVVLLLALGWLLSRILRGFAQLLQAPSKPARALLLNSIPGNEGSVERLMEAPRMEMSQHFDGRAHEVRKSLLFITVLCLGPHPFPEFSLPFTRLHFYCHH
ncbi:cadherin-related family member 4 isoform X4 [Peromyscus californicus insignis]|uniref:cadherin-related family member 4 isoform X4 n=1 Tax=Peromyscus californicus insignis TaxID=564181 RepID=UPI0022A725E1|nr:cadherin-related family member 4 isoform X4 [Peromyscus californicus insignis]